MSLACSYAYRATRVRVYALRRHPDAVRHVWLAAYVYLRGRAVTDTLVDLLIETVHHIGVRAETKVEQEMLDDLKRVGGKQDLLFNLANAAVEKPDGTMREVVFPLVDEQTLRDLVRESKATSPIYRSTLRATIRSSYRGHSATWSINSGAFMIPSSWRREGRTSSAS